MNSFIFYNSSLEKNFQRLKSKEVMLKIKVAGLPSLTQLYNDLYPYAQKKTNRGRYTFKLFFRKYRPLV